MKLTHAGDLMIDGQPRRGVFIECKTEEVASLMRRVNIADEVTVERLANPPT